jgi:hypothetical protein
MADPQPPKGYENYIQIPKESPDLVAPPKGYEGYIPYENPITAASKKIAPLVGRYAAEALPAIGSLLGLATPIPGAALGGTLIGTGLMQRLKGMKPEMFGEPPQGWDAAANATKEVLTNIYLPKIFGGLGGLALKTDMQGIGPAIAARLSNFPAVRQPIIQNIADQAFNRLYPKPSILEQGAVNASEKYGVLSDAIKKAKLDFPDLPPSRSLETVGGKLHLIESPGGSSPQVLATTKEMGDVFGENTVGAQLVKLHKEYLAGTDVSGSQEFNSLGNIILRDLRQVRNAKIVAGPDLTNDLAVNHLLTTHGDPGAGTIDAKKILGELDGGDKELYNEAFLPASESSFKGLMKEMADLQDKNITDTVLSFSNRRLLWNLAGGTSGAILGGLFGHAGIGAIAGGAAAETPVITNWMLGRIMQNPEAVKLVRAALTTSVKAPQAGLLQKALTQILPRIIQGEADLAFVPER